MIFQWQPASCSEIRCEQVTPMYKDYRMGHFGLGDFIETPKTTTPRGPKTWDSFGLSHFGVRPLRFGPFRSGTVLISYQPVQSPSVEFSNVNNSGQCFNHLVNLLTRWLLRHGKLIVHFKIIGKIILNHCWQGGNASGAETHHTML